MVRWRRPNFRRGWHPSDGRLGCNPDPITEARGDLRSNLAQPRRPILSRHQNDRRHPHERGPQKAPAVYDHAFAAGQVGAGLPDREKKKASLRALTIGREWGRAIWRRCRPPPGAAGGRPPPRPRRMSKRNTWAPLARAEHSQVLAAAARGFRRSHRPRDKPRRGRLFLPTVDLSGERGKLATRHNVAFSKVPCSTTTVRRPSRPIRHSGRSG